MRNFIHFIGKGVIFCLILFFYFSLSAQEVRRLGLDPERIYRLTIPADIHWTDTGFDVRAGQELYFSATGVVCLQVGNPISFPCGPEGLDLKTVQQPIHEKNIGALIGRIVLLVSVDVDEETGEETRNEVIKYFFVGERGRILMPLDGKLYLGLNELLVEDNSGEYVVEMQMLSRESSR